MKYDPRFQHLRDELRLHLRALSAANANSMSYYKRRWDETPGGERVAWGCSDWYFEVSPDGTVTRQLESFDNGTVLRYHADLIEDDFGCLSEVALDHDEYRPFGIPREEFEAGWKTSNLSSF